MRISKYRKRRFLSNFKPSQDHDCWEWEGDLCSNGYGDLAFCEKGKRTRIFAHRFSYVFYKGPLEEGKYICHACDNPKCVNPNHLFQGSPKDNVRDMFSKGRQPQRKMTHCRRGHPLVEGNIYHNKKYKKRCCLICKRLKS